METRGGEIPTPEPETKLPSVGEAGTGKLVRDYNRVLSELAHHGEEVPRENGSGLSSRQAEALAIKRTLQGRGFEFTGKGKFDPEKTSPKLRDHFLETPSEESDDATEE